MKVAGYTTLGTFLTALIGTLVVFGVDMNDAQTAALVGLVASAIALGPMVSGWFTRREVYAPATVAGMMADADQRLADATSQPGPDASRRWPKGIV